MRSESTKSSGYNDLLGLAQSRNIRVIEAEGLGNDSGLRFSRKGSDYIALNSGLPESEKTRALGFLLDNYRSGADPAPSGGDMHLSSLHCPIR